jgi:hypothetical protein
VVGLEAREETLRDAEVASQAQVGVGCDRALAEHDLIDAPRRHADGFGQRRLRQIHRFQEFLHRISPGCGLGRRSVTRDDLDLVRIAITPDEAHPPSVVDADRVLPAAITDRRLQPVGRRHGQVLKPTRTVQETCSRTRSHA